MTVERPDPTRKTSEDDGSWALLLVLVVAIAIWVVVLAAALVWA